MDETVLLLKIVWEWLVINWTWIKYAIGIWILISAFMVVIICMNSSRLSRIDEPSKEPSDYR